MKEGSCLVRRGIIFRRLNFSFLKSKVGLFLVPGGLILKWVILKRQSVKFRLYFLKLSPLTLLSPRGLFIELY